MRITGDQRTADPAEEVDAGASVTRRLEERLIDSIENHEGVTRRAVLGGLAVAGGSAIMTLGTAQSEDTEDEERVTGFGRPGNTRTNSSTLMASFGSSTRGT